jgi:NAD(P)H-flavin reductase
MRKLAEQQHNFHYTACVSGSQVPEGFASGRVNDVALANFDNLSGWTVYLCGHPEMVEQMKIATFLKGTATGDIYSDAFLIDRSGIN